MSKRAQTMDRTYLQESSRRTLRKVSSYETEGRDDLREFNRAALSLSDNPVNHPMPERGGPCTNVGANGMALELAWREKSM
jgi:hypothetical protein